MIETYRCDDKELLVAYLYDDIDPVERRRVEEHLRICPACAAEAEGLGGVRQSLASWVPPEADLGFVVVPRAQIVSSADEAPRGQVLRPARWWRVPAQPSWALQAAAAVLVLAAGLSVANLQVRYGNDGLVVTTGWMAPAAPAASSLAGVSSAGLGQNASPRATEDWRPALAALADELRGEIRTSRGQPAPVNASASRSLDEPTMRRISELIQESERRQQRELALRLTQFGRDIEVQRRTDNRRNFQAIGQFEGLAGAEIARQRQMMDYIMRVSAQQPPPQ
jgi:hypothetical protein